MLNKNVFYRFFMILNDNIENIFDISSPKNNQNKL
jgi:hypothetical protein